MNEENIVLLLVCRPAVAILSVILAIAINFLHHIIPLLHCHLGPLAQ